MTCPTCNKPCEGKYCPGSKCRNADWSLMRALGAALVDDGVLSRSEARRYLESRESVQRAVHGAMEPIDARGLFCTKAAAYRATLEDKT